MARVKHRVGIRGDVTEIYTSLIHPEKLSRWWASSASGIPQAGEKLNLVFAELATLTFSLSRLQADQEVILDCTNGPGPWQGSRLLFTLENANGQVFLTLVHENTSASDDDFLYFNTKWPIYLLSLRDYIETGSGHPYPRDIKIHFGD